MAVNWFYSSPLLVLLVKTLPRSEDMQMQMNNFLLNEINIMVLPLLILEMYILSKSSKSICRLMSKKDQRFAVLLQYLYDLR